MPGRESGQSLGKQQSCDAHTATKQARSQPTKKKLTRSDTNRSKCRVGPVTDASQLRCSQENKASVDLTQVTARRARLRAGDQAREATPGLVIVRKVRFVKVTGTTGTDLATERWRDEGGKGKKERGRKICSN